MGCGVRKSYDFAARVRICVELPVGFDLILFVMIPPNDPTSERSARPAGEALRGLIERVTFHNEETGFAVLKVQVKGHRDLVTVIGSLPVVSAGEWITAEGEWVFDREHGRQLKAVNVQTQPPDSIEGIEKYLASGMIKGIGPVYAQKLVAKFGRDVFDIIEKQSARLQEVDGIGRERRQRIKEAWAEQRQVREIMVFLHAHGISTSRAVRIYKTFGEDAIGRIRMDPYCLAREIRGIGFKSADAIAMTLGVEKESVLRVRAGLAHALDEAAADGHCCVPRRALASAAAALLEVGGPLAEDVLTGEIVRGELVAETLERDEMVFLPSIRCAEQLIAERLSVMAGRAGTGYPEIDLDRAIEWVQQRTGKTLSDSQQRALRMVVQSGCAIITGGPGVGKTTLVNSILQILGAKKVRCVLCAPTGRAAKRLNESTGLEAKTIHRLLEPRPGGGFLRDESNPLVGDLFVMDEVSMVDVALMARFLRALPRRANLLLVGDPDQLPSVGPGLVLRDLIESAVVPVESLDVVFRQAGASLIVEAAHDVNAGRVPSSVGSTSPEADFFFIDREDSGAAADALVDLVARRIPGKFGLDPLRDIQVLTPMNRGTLGVRNLNERLQSALNTTGGPAVERFGVSFRAGDKVIQTRNNYDKDVFNGDIGVIRSLSIDDRELLIDFDGRRVTYDFGELDEVDPAFAITVHKSQGSEFPCVVIPLAMEQYVLLQRNLLYTGITRGKKLVILIGQKKALSAAIRNQEVRHRATGLRWRLQHTGAV